MTGGVELVDAPAHDARQVIRSVAAGGNWIGPFSSVITAVGISHAMYATTMPPMVFRSSSPASTPSPNAHSSEHGSSTPS